VTDLDDLRDRLLGERFFDIDNKEAFTVVGFTSPGLALLQYDDGTPWDEGVSNYAMTEESARKFGLDEDGLDSERYIPLGAGPRVQQVCAVETHDWFPWPDEIWPGGPSEEVREAMQTHPRDLYNRFVRCRQCGLSASAAAEFGPYSSDGHHQAPWFCHNCGEAHPGNNLVYRREKPHCLDCADQYDEAQS
jgi:hypothetical protein